MVNHKITKFIEDNSINLGKKPDIRSPIEWSKMAKVKYGRVFFGWPAFPIWLALATYGLTELFASHPAATETVYSQRIYPIFAFILSYLSKWVSFSMDDAFYGLLAVFVIILLILTVIRKIKIGSFFLLILQTVAICYVLFYWFWGFNYYRSGINDRLQIAKSRSDTIQFVRVFENLITQTNESYCTYENTDYSEIDSLVEASYKKNASFLKLKYPHGNRRPKSITLSGFFAKASIAGYYGPFFSEIHLNDSLMMIEYPHVLAHESAHQFGITSEAEANFYSWLVCSHSESAYLRYSANINMISYFLSKAKHLHNFADLVHQIDKPVFKDLRKVQDHWENLRSEEIERVAGTVNDAYLKTNKIEKGVEDYFGVVQFVMDYSTDSLAQKRVISSQ